MTTYRNGSQRVEITNGIVTYSDFSLCPVGQKPDTKALKACGWKKVVSPKTYYAHGGTSSNAFSK